jgi:hypothetical protein
MVSSARLRFLTYVKPLISLMLILMGKLPNAGSDPMFSRNTAPDQAFWSDRCEDPAMSFLDKMIAAVTPPESDEKRMQARKRARAEVDGDHWLAVVIDHHEQIEAAFGAVRNAADGTARRAAQKQLQLLLTGHSNAEEAVLYPALAEGGHKTHAGMAYEEQAMTKIQLALLETLDPASQDYLDKLEHIRGAVTHHMYQEESDWFLELKGDVNASRQLQLGARFREEMDRYLGTPAAT